MAVIGYEPVGFDFMCCVPETDWKYVPLHILQGGAPKIAKLVNITPITRVD